MFNSYVSLPEGSLPVGFFFLPRRLCLLWWHLPAVWSKDLGKLKHIVGFPEKRIGTDDSQHCFFWSELFLAGKWRIVILKSELVNQIPSKVWNQKPLTYQKLLLVTAIPRKWSIWQGIGFKTHWFDLCLATLWNHSGLQPLPNGRWSRSKLM